MKNLLFGVSYYDEYMPYDRLAQDIPMMKKASINVLRIAESTWSTCEPQPGVFDFSHVTRVMDAAEEAGLSIIIGMPTYAVPTWMAKAHPEIMVVTKDGQSKYGPRQLMDITAPMYRFYAERVIRKLMEVTAKRPCVIGFQVDNETKHYGTAGQNVQQAFVKYLREKFNNDLDAFNAAFGMDYWSNRLNAWEDYVDITGTCNGSLAAEFEKFQRTLVTEFLQWQANIVGEYKREDQFITHNFDGGWRNLTFGVQPDVDHYEAAKAVTVTGYDIYHPTQSQLTGKEIAFHGSNARALKDGANYLVLETQAQGFPHWVPYRGQLRLQAYSHLAQGANSVLYWHWHSIHNSAETYWKGLLSHDFAENETYLEACKIGAEFAAHGERLVNLKKKNDVAILVSNTSLTALSKYPIAWPNPSRTEYNDVVRWMFDAMYDCNIECDVLWEASNRYDEYKVIIVPAMYAVCEQTLRRLVQFVADGGHIVVSFKSAFANENASVYPEVQPHILREALGVKYHQFTLPEASVLLAGEVIEKEEPAQTFMELLIPEGAKVLARYDHDNWKDYAAITMNAFGKGTATYIATQTSPEVLKNVYEQVLQAAGLQREDVPTGVSVRKGVNDFGHTLRYYLNYTPKEQTVTYTYAPATEVLTEAAVATGEQLQLAPWGVAILEEM